MPIRLYSQIAECQWKHISQYSLLFRETLKLSQKHLRATPDYPPPVAPRARYEVMPALRLESGVDPGRKGRKESLIEAFPQVMDQQYQ